MGIRWLFCLLLVAGACSSGGSAARDAGGDARDSGRDATAGLDSGATGQDAGRDAESPLLDGSPAEDAAVADAGRHVPTREDMAALVLNGTIPPADLPAPQFTVTAHTGDPRTRAALLGHPTVMWFYPEAFTGG